MHPARRANFCGYRAQVSVVVVVVVPKEIRPRLISDMMIVLLNALYRNLIITEFGQSGIFRTGKNPLHYL